VCKRKRCPFGMVKIDGFLQIGGSVHAIPGSRGRLDSLVACVFRLVSCSASSAIRVLLLYHCCLWSTSPSCDNRLRSFSCNVQFHASTLTFSKIEFLQQFVFASTLQALSATSLSALFSRGVGASVHLGRRLSFCSAFKHYPARDDSARADLS
jgi:hypothetical protein